MTKHIAYGEDSDIVTECERALLLVEQQLAAAGIEHAQLGSSDDLDDLQAAGVLGSDVEIGSETNEGVYCEPVAYNLNGAKRQTVRLISWRASDEGEPIASVSTITPMGDDEFKRELLSRGYTEDEIDEAIRYAYSVCGSAVHITGWRDWLADLDRAEECWPPKVDGAGHFLVAAKRRRLDKCD